ncbi:MAG: DUF624 domain-containing protein [Clostridia bacterium]|nr:DUF624 domain-containing protein [Clostridia bacterium]
MAKKYENMNDYNSEPELKKKRMTLNPFENMFKKDGKGVEKDEVKVLDKPGLVNFFKLLQRKLNHIFSVNILMIFGNFPIFFGLLAFAYTMGEGMAPASGVYPLLRGASYFDNSPIVMSLLGAYGNQDTVAMPSTASIVLFALTLLVLITFGLVNVGTTYIIRNLIRGEQVYIMSDFWYAIKRNWKQGIIYGIIDILLIAVLAYDIIYYRTNMGVSALFMTMYVAGYCMIILYGFVRMYAYPMIVTFDMKLWKIIKNSIFFAVLGIKRNVMALLGAVIVVGLDLILIRVFLPIGAVIPFIILFGLLQYMSVYAAFPKIKQIMIDPYYKEVESEENAET